jgi:hypothetical protein
MEDANERRMSERFEVACVGVSAKDDQEFVLWITNISQLGLGFCTKKHLKENERLLVRLKAKDILESVEVRGSVVWVKEADRASYQVGFRLDPISRTRITEILGREAK